MTGPQYYRTSPHGYETVGEGYEKDERADRLLVISAAGCGELLEGTGYRHGQILETDLDGALRVVRKLHEHGLDVTFGRMSSPLLQIRGPRDLHSGPTVRGVRCIWVVPVNWNELA